MPFDDKHHATTSCYLYFPLPLARARISAPNDERSQGGLDGCAQRAAYSRDYRVCVGHIIYSCICLLDYQVHVLIT